MPSTIFTSNPTLAKAATRVVRKWHSIPDAITDEDALAQGIITPQMIELIMQIVTSLLNGCLNKPTASALKQIQDHIGGNPMSRLANNMRLNGLVDKWLYTMGTPRERGDVVMIRESLVSAAGSTDNAELSAIQQEVFSWSMI